MKTIFATISLIFVFASLTAEASASNSFSALDSLEDFSQSFAQRWTFDCHLTKDFLSEIQLQVDAKTPPKEGTTSMAEITEEGVVEQYRNEALIGVFNGLSKIAKINPDLLKMIFANAQNQKLDWHCDLTDKLYYAGAYTKDQHFNPFYQSSISVRAPGLLKLIGGSPVYFRMTAFHEFLHFAGADNESANRHTKAVLSIINTPPQPGLASDVVYACTAQAYPGTFQLETKSDSGDLKLYNNSKNICEVCARARPNAFGFGTKIKHTAQVDTQAQAACSDINDDDFYYGTWKMNEKYKSWSIYTRRMKEFEEKYLRDLAESRARSEKIQEQIRVLIRNGRVVSMPKPAEGQK